jgi:GNAT superfamily N-acetyltransferase
MARPTRSSAADPEPVVRALESADWEPIQTLCAGALEAQFGSLANASRLGQSPHSHARQLFAIAQGDASSVLVATIDTRVVAMVSLSGPIGGEPGNEAAGPYVMLSDLFVAPEFQRRGIATRLLERAHEHARTLGARRMALKVMGDNERGRAFYRRHGYRTRFTVLDREL